MKSEITVNHDFFAWFVTDMHCKPVLLYIVSISLKKIGTLVDMSRLAMKNIFLIQSR